MTSKIKISYQPGSDIEGVAETIGSILLSEPSWVNAILSSLTGAQISASTGIFGSVITNILNATTGIGYIGSLTSNVITSGSGNINNLSSGIIISGTGFINNVVSDNVTADVGKITTYNLTGTSAFFSSSLSSHDITGTSGFLDNLFVGIITGTEIYSSVMGDSASFTAITGGDVFISTQITGGSAFFTEISSPMISVSQITEGSALFEAITGTSASVSTCLVGSITGGSANFSTITGTNIYTENLTGSQISISSLTGGSANFLSGFFLTLTGIINFYANTGSIFSITGSTLFSSETIETNGAVVSGSLRTSNIFSPSGSVEINNLSGDTIVIGANTLNPTGFNTSWTTESANMGGELAPHAYMFSVSDDMKKQVSYNTSYNSVWNGVHYISSNGGVTWYPCIGTIGISEYDMNGGISVSRDGTLWIGTRTSTGNDGGIYKSTDGSVFSQALSVPMTGILEGSTFECCSISSNNQTILVCTDSPQSSTNYQVPFYISRNSGNDWTIVIPSSTNDHYWISSSAISYDGQYMLALDRGGVFTSVDYGNTWNLKGPQVGGYSGKVSMSQDGTHMYLCSADSSILFMFSLDFGQTWIFNPPNLSYSYSGVSCDVTGRYVYLIGDTHALWFSNNYGQSFTMFNITGMTDLQMMWMLVQMVQV